MKTPKLMALLFLTAAVLSTVPVARAQAPSDTSGGLPPGVTRMFCVQGPRDPVWDEAEQNAANAVTHGDALLKKGKIEMAIRCYEDSMTYEPDNASALQSLAEAYALSNRVSEASKTYHHLFYETRWEGVGGNPTVYLGYALLLAKSGQSQEAMKFYHEGARLLNFDADGKQNLKVMLPTFGDAEGQFPYSPQMLEAMTYVGLAIYSQDEKEKLAHLDAAIKLKPDMPQAYYYKGHALWCQAGRYREALAAYQQARRLTGIDTQLFIDKEVSEFGLEKEAALEQAREKKAAPNK